MSASRRVMTGLFALSIGLGLALIVLWHRRPLWILPVLAFLFTGAALLARRRGTGWSDDVIIASDRDAIPAEPRPAALPAEARRFSRIALPSARKDYDFLFSATVRWLENESPGTRMINEVGVARQAIIERAAAITERWDASRWSSAEAVLNGELGVMQLDRTRQLYVMAEEIVLVLADHDRKRLELLADIRKEEEVWVHERQREMERRRYLGEDVLKSPGSAVVWWLHKQDNRIGETIENLEALGRLSAAVNGQDLPMHLDRRLTDPSNGGTEAGDQIFLNGGEPDAGSAQPKAVVHFERFLTAAGLPSDNGLRPLLARQVALYLRDDAPGIAHDLIASFDPTATASEPCPEPGVDADTSPPSPGFPPTTATATEPEPN